MNYISHYYCLKDKNPYSTLGTLLPDILPHFSYLHNKYFLKYDSSLLDKEEIKLWEGIENHYVDDKFFHSMSFFKEGMAYIEEQMNMYIELSVLRRKYLISHVLYELTLDHMVLQRYPEITFQIYKDLEQVKLGILESFLRKIIGQNNEISLFLDSYRRFLKRRFLNFYAAESNLVKSLHMVSGKISQWEYNELMVDRFTDIVRKLKVEIDFNTVFESIIKHKK